ncbi:MAG: NarL family two-component system response regulator LiaR [Cellvibrionaceae bacterium]|jgi:NarL family two-component system response regulator LiaR
MIRVFQADDHAIVRDGMRWLLMGEEGIELVGEASNGEEAVQEISRLQPDIVLLDLHMPKLSGIEAIPQILEKVPTAKVIVITSFSDDDHIFSALQAGAIGYLLKDTVPQKILRAIRDTANGQSSLEPEIARRLLHYVRKSGGKNLPLSEDPLTDREVDILKLVAQGLANQVIAEHLVVSERTVRTHVSNILGKLHLANRTQAALYALREGIANLDDVDDEYLRMGR